MSSPHHLPAPDAAIIPDGAAGNRGVAQPIPRFLYWLLGGLTVFFLLVTLFQLRSLQQRIDSPPTLDLATALSPLDEGATTTADRLMYAQWRTLAALEQHVLERRYHQANVLLLSRTWTSYLGFMTGMILALLGAGFVMGKLREEASTLGVKNAAVEANITSTSPGLVLCMLGVVLMLTTLIAHSDIETRDANPLYTRVLLAPSGDGAPAPLPLPVGEMEDPLAGDTLAAPDP